MRRFIVIACLSFFILLPVPFANAQDISGVGLWGGVGINNFKGSDFTDKPELKENMKLGPVVGVAIFPPVPNELLLFQVNIYYVLRGDKWVNETNDEVTYSLHYMGGDALLRLVIPLSKFFKPYLAGGGYFELPFIGAYKIKSSNGDSTSGNIEDLEATTLHFLDLGLAAEGGLQFRIGKGYLFLSSRYNLGLINVLGDDTDPYNITWFDIKNRGLSFSVGYMSIFKEPGKKEPAAEPQPVTPSEPGMPSGSV